MIYNNIIREYDVPYHVRVSIDLDIFVGHWYTIRQSFQKVNFFLYMYICIYFFEFSRITKIYKINKNT